MLRTLVNLKQSRRGKLIRTVARLHQVDQEREVMGEVVYDNTHARDSLLQDMKSASTRRFNDHRLQFPLQRLAELGSSLGHVRDRDLEDL